MRVGRKKPKGRPSHRQRNFQASGGQEDEARFSVYQRQNLNDDSDFFRAAFHTSPPAAYSLTLARYNGPSHPHHDISYRPHIHRASERAIAAGKKPETEAEETGRFENLGGALACLIADFNLAGLDVPNDHQMRML